MPANAQMGLRLELPKEVSAVETARLALLQFIEPTGPESGVINRIEVVLEELVSNVVRHADQATRIVLSAKLCEQGLLIWIEDDGAAFDPLAAQENAPFDRLENATLGGLGIPLIKRLTKSVDYERCGDINRMKVMFAL